MIKGREMLEADLKRAVSDYLQYQANLGQLMYLRLNAGSFILQNADGSYRRRVQGVEKGTADFVVFQGVEHSVLYQGKSFKPIIPRVACRVTFLEIKSSQGRQTKEQKDFELEVTKHHCRYFIVRDADTLAELLEV